MFLLLEHIPKLIFASILGGVLGVERSKKGAKSVGYGTCSIISIGTTLLTILSVYGLGSNSDPSRLISNIITAIGFLCAGVIFTRPAEDDTEDQEVVGLTTGATIFCLAAMGIAIGLGYYALVTCVAILIEVNLFISKKIKKKN